MTTRKKYPKELKLDAISLVVDQGYSQAEAVCTLGIKANMLGRWIHEQRFDGAQPFRENGRLTPNQEEVVALQKQAKRLEMEKENQIKRRISLQPKRSEIFVYRPAEEYLSHTTHVQGAGPEEKRLLPVSKQCCPYARS